MQIGPLPAGARHLPGDDIECAPLNTEWFLPWAPELLPRIHQGVTTVIQAMRHAHVAPPPPNT